LLNGQLVQMCGVAADTKDVALSTTVFVTSCA
jgi:hypothetical protein